MTNTTDIAQLRDIFPTWCFDDLNAALNESGNDLEITIQRISEGYIVPFHSNKIAVASLAPLAPKNKSPKPSPKSQLPKRERKAATRNAVVGSPVSASNITPIIKKSTNSPFVQESKFSFSAALQKNDTVAIAVSVEDAKVDMEAKVGKFEHINESIEKVQEKKTLVKEEQVQEVKEEEPIEQEEEQQQSQQQPQQEEERFSMPELMTCRIPSKPVEVEAIEDTFSMPSKTTSVTCAPPVTITTPSPSKLSVQALFHSAAASSTTPSSSSPTPSQRLQGQQKDSVPPGMVDPYVYQQQQQHLHQQQYTRNSSDSYYSGNNQQYFNNRASNGWNINNQNNASVVGPTTTAAATATATTNPYLQQHPNSPYNFHNAMPYVHLDESTYATSYNQYNHHQQQPIYHQNQGNNLNRYSNSYYLPAQHHQSPPPPLPSASTSASYRQSSSQASSNVL